MNKEKVQSNMGTRFQRQEARKIYILVTIKKVRDKRIIGLVAERIRTLEQSSSGKVLV